MHVVSFLSKRIHGARIQYKYKEKYRKAIWRIKKTFTKFVQPEIISFFHSELCSFPTFSAEKFAKILIQSKQLKLKQTHRHRLSKRMQSFRKFTDHNTIFNEKCKNVCADEF